MRKRTNKKTSNTRSASAETGWCLLSPEGKLISETFDTSRWGVEVGAYGFISRCQPDWFKAHPTAYWKDVVGFQKALEKNGWYLVKAERTVRIIP